MATVGIGENVGTAVDEGEAVGTIVDVEGVVGITVSVEVAMGVMGSGLPSQATKPNNKMQVTFASHFINNSHISCWEVSQTDDIIRQSISKPNPMCERIHN